MLKQFFEANFYSLMSRKVFICDLLSVFRVWPERKIFEVFRCYRNEPTIIAFHAP